MVVENDILEKEDMYILDRMKEFISNDEVIRFAAAKQLMISIERAVWFIFASPLTPLKVYYS
jgi:son of sevenless-like protein